MRNKKSIKNLPLYPDIAEKLDRYYISSTILQPEERLKAHLSEYCRNSNYTPKGLDTSGLIDKMIYIITVKSYCVG